MSENSTPLSEIPVVILCGGMGTRLREASGDKVPKPLVDIGGRPILWHIMKIYREAGFRKFVLCLGYKGDQIKRDFLDYREHLSDFTLRPDDVAPQFHAGGNAMEDWEITFVETGLLTGTGAHPQCHLPGVQQELRGHRRRGAPADDPPGVGVGDERGEPCAGHLDQQVPMS